MSQNQPSKRSITAGRALALLPLSLLAIAGCAQIIGLDSYTVGSGAGGTGASGGSAGSAAKGGSGGSGGTVSGNSGESGAGSGGTSVAGTPGEAGANEAGTGGGTPPTQNVGCDHKTPFTVNENIMRSCILRAGCSPYDPVRTISECVSKNTQAALPGESCNLASKTCADFEACEHIGIAHDDLCGGTQITRCDANGVAINCGNYDVDQFYDCKGLGGTCGTFVFTFSDNTTDVYADCKIPVTPANACTGLSDDTAYYCQPGSGTTPDARYYCYGGQAYGATCGKFASCVDTTDTTQASPTPDATCYFNFSATCPGADSATCSSGVAKLCSAGDVISYDCSSVGLDCATKGTDGYCVAPGCTPATVDKCVESCGDDGTTLNFCYGGVPYSVDCTTYGFGSCVVGSITNSDNTVTSYAACR